MLGRFVRVWRRVRLAESTHGLRSIGQRSSVQKLVVPSARSRASLLCPDLGMRWHVEIKYCIVCVRSLNPPRLIVNDTVGDRAK